MALPPDKSKEHRTRASRKKNRAKVAANSRQMQRAFLAAANRPAKRLSPATPRVNWASGRSWPFCNEI